jgi:carbon monoxide dehydrogenase subunit G
MAVMNCRKIPGSIRTRDHAATSSPTNDPVHPHGELGRWLRDDSRRRAIVDVRRLALRVAVWGESRAMASIRREIVVRKPKDEVWDAIRDVGAIHQRLVPGFVVDCRLEGDSRYLTFGNGMTIRELIVDVDDRAYRHAWSARGGPFTHHNASIQVYEEPNGSCRLVWIADVLPHEVAGPISAMIEQGLETMKATLEA